jgi:hypothetical protein
LRPSAFAIKYFCNHPHCIANAIAAISALGPLCGLNTPDGIMGQKLSFQNKKIARKLAYNLLRIS